MTGGIWSRGIPLEERQVRIETPCRIGVLSDTHLWASGRSRRLEEVVSLFRRANVDLILHAGDIGQASVLDDLGAFAPVEAVRGNADSHDLLEILPDRVWVHAGKRTLLLLHGHHGKTAISAARAAATSEIDLIVFGHSHMPFIEEHGSTILFNPGSPTERRWNPHFGIGLISLFGESLEPELVLFDDARHLDNVMP